jgi:hypothetical protein
MFAHRVVVHAGAAIIMTLMSGCDVGYGGARCRAITLQTPPSSLPLGSRGPVPEASFSQVQPFIAGTGALGCCVANPFFSERADCAAVDCEALRARLTVASVQGPYVDEPCGRQETPIAPHEGTGQCSVYLEGETIVGVRANCRD